MEEIQSNNIEKIISIPDGFTAEIQDNQIILKEEKKLNDLELILYSWLSDDTSGQLDKKIMRELSVNRAKSVTEIVRQQLEPEFEKQIELAYKNSDRVQFKKGYQSAFQKIMNILEENSDIVINTIENNQEKTFFSANLIDLGLPSGRLWADRNVGADKPEDYGLFFRWGDTQGYTASQVGSDEGKKYFGWADYKFNPSGDGSTMTKYNNTDGKTILDIEDDAARINMGGNWRMPTTDEFQELFNDSYTTNIWTTSNGVNGRLVTSKSNGNSIFLPAAGYANLGSMNLVGSGGYYWSSSLDSVQGAFDLLFSSRAIYPADGYYRYYGFSVRAVQ